MIKKILFFFLCAGFLSSCVTVKEYEKVYMNDPDMVLNARKSKRFIIQFPGLS